nr:MAG TPA: hypothetical protein [Caudoviricetes sp.]
MGNCSIRNLRGKLEGIAPIFGHMKETSREEKEEIL